MLDLGTLKIGIEVDDKQAKQSLQNFENEVGKSEGGLKSKFSGIAKSAKTALKVGIVTSVAAASAAFVKISKDALNAYATFEQLEGGVAKIFGDDAKAVMDNASKAFQTAGISANQYMEQATSFSASLIQSLNGDTQKAAQTTDMAIQDMADNANVFGSSMESIQNAYQGFAKQNYTMLDNLKLGYGGTKTEMERLLADAEAITGIHYDISSLDDVYNAIHVIQGEMNITGTTAREAANTIEGSVNSAKAAWQNFLVGLGDDDADMATLTANLVTSIGNVIKNVGPRLGVIAKNLVKTVLDTAKNSDIKGPINQLLNKVLDALKKAPQMLMTFVVNTVNQLADALESQGGGKLASKAGAVLANVFTTLIKNLPALVGAVIRLLTNLFQRGVESVGRAILGIIRSIVNSVIKAWNNLKKAITAKIHASIDTGALSKFKNWIDNVKSAWEKLKETLRHPIKALVNYAKSGDTGGTSQRRIGLREVPYDGYQAILHKGEAVLTAAEANQYNRAIGRIIADDDLLTKRADKYSPVQNTEHITNYTFGDITVDVSRLEDVKTVTEFVDMMRQAKAFV